MSLALGLLVCKTMASLQFPTCSPTFPVDVSAPSSTRSSTLFYPKRSLAPAGCSFRSSLVVRAVSQKEALESLSNVVTDERVPEGHQGLHGFLYGEDGADIHDSKSKEFSGRGAEDDGSSIVGFENYVDARERYKFAGVYAVYGINGTLQYVGYSRNVPLSLKTHRNRVGSDRCSAVRVKLFTDPAMITKTRLEEERQGWLSQGDVPPGNANERDLWESAAGAQSLRVMSEKDRTEYEEKKLKMRKAMGENLHDAVVGEDDDARTRRMKLLQATEGDDWSSVIDGQTRDTVDQTSPTISKTEEQEREGTEPVISPFVEATPQQNRGLYSADRFDFTLKNVDMVLDDVRPYLVADGGNVEVVSIDNGVVSLRLQGACGTCPSSTVTMKMGIERVLKEKFGEAVKEVLQVDQQTITASVMGINAHLDILRPAINNYGGSVEVISVENGVCQVKFKGPPPIGMGIQAAIKDKFPEVTSVVLIDV